MNADFRTPTALLLAAGFAIFTLAACEAEPNADPRAEMQLNSGANTVNNDAAVAVSGDFVSFAQRIGDQSGTDTSARSHLELNWKEYSSGRVAFDLDGEQAEGTWLTGNYRIVDTATTLILYDVEAGGGHAPKGRVASLRMKLNETHDTLHLRGSLGDSNVDVRMVRTYSLR